MAILITDKVADRMGDNELYRYSCEASEIGLRPGVFPKVLKTTLGNGQPFDREPGITRGDFVRYLQRYGCISLTVFND
jgi:hypothetical protein